MHREVAERAEQALQHRRVDVVELEGDVGAAVEQRPERVAGLADAAEAGEPIGGDDAVRPRALDDLDLHRVLEATGGNLGAGSRPHPTVRPDKLPVGHRVIVERLLVGDHLDEIEDLIRRQRDPDRDLHRLWHATESS